MIQDFLTCPKHYYDRYILKKIEDRQSSALHFGSAMHLGIKTILEGEDGIETFNMYWDSIKDKKMLYYGDNWESLKKVATETFLPNFKSRHVKHFTDFEQELQMEMPFLSCTLQGTADLIGLYKGKLAVIDWKTSSKPYKRNKIAINYQMYIYAKLYQQKTGKLPELLVYKVFNKKDESINTFEIELTQAYLDKIFEQIENVSQRLLEVSTTGAIYHGADCYCERA